MPCGLGEITIRHRQVLCPKIFVPQQEFLIDRSGDVGHHPRPKHFGFPLDLPPIESEIVDAVFQPEKPIRGEPVESCKLRYFNSFEFFDHTGSPHRLQSNYSARQAIFMPNSAEFEAQGQLNHRRLGSGRRQSNPPPRRCDQGQS
jgi:hypothetical protein